MQAMEMETTSENTPLLPPLEGWHSEKSRHWSVKQQRTWASVRKDTWTVLTFKSATLNRQHGTMQRISYAVEIAVFVLILLNVAVAMLDSTASSGSCRRLYSHLCGNDELTCGWMHDRHDLDLVHMVPLCLGLLLLC